MQVFRFLTLFVIVALVFTTALWLATPAVDTLVKSEPEESSFMRLRKHEAEEQGKKLKIRQSWLPLNAISPYLRTAVIVSEDGAFYAHAGVDWHELKVSFEQNLSRGRIVRGGSTITQQLAKNLYLTPSKNPVRKLREAAIAYELEAELSKQRILELYLNFIEWGDGIFGAEAAAQHYFGISARQLTEEQAALLAAIIPSPLVWGKNLNQRIVQNRKQKILRRMRRYGAQY